MKLHNRAPQDLQRFRKETRATKALEKEPLQQERLRVKLSFLMAASLTMLTTSRFALPTRMDVANSRALQARDVLADIISVTRAVVSGTNPITCATTLTEFRSKQFHKCISQIHRFSLSFSPGVGICPVLPHKQASQF